MNALPRCFLCALTAQTLLFGVCAVRPDLAERLNLNVWKMPEMERQIEQAQSDIDQRGTALSEVQERLGCRERIADEVAEGRMGLLEAAARFRDLNAGLPWGYPGASDEVRCCRQVIAWVTTHVEQKSTAEAEIVAERLENELREHLYREDRRDSPFRSDSPTRNEG
jgi:hypothetical protein